MQLTEVQSLTAEYSQTDVHEMVTVMQSTFPTTPSSVLRWGNVASSDAQQWLLKATRQAMATEFQLSRIATMQNNKQPPSTPHAEHLVVRDLDLEHLETSEHTATTPGRIVAHADYRYAPAFGRAVEEFGEVETTTNPQNPWPQGFGTELHVKIGDMVESTLSKLFKGLPCFELYGISTLTPSHLRKGIAKRLTEWVFPYADRFSLPVILCASPLGLPLYRKCGFEEYREHDIKIELEKYGGEGLHMHVPMVRWPMDETKMPEAWKEWRTMHKAGPTLSE